MKFHKNGESLRKPSQLFLELILIIGNLSKLTALERRSRLIRKLLKMLNVRKRVSELIGRDQIKPLAVDMPAKSPTRR